MISLIRLVAVLKLCMAAGENLASVIVQLDKKSLGRGDGVCDDIACMDLIKMPISLTRVLGEVGSIKFEVSSAESVELAFDRSIMSSPWSITIISSEIHNGVPSEKEKHTTTRFGNVSDFTRGLENLFKVYNILAFD